MFRKYLISKMTQISAWIGLLVIIAALFLPRSIEIFFGILLILNDDAWLSARFSKMRSFIEQEWKE